MSRQTHNKLREQEHLRYHFYVELVAYAHSIVFCDGEVLVDWVLERGVWMLQVLNAYFYSGFLTFSVKHYL